MKRHVLSIELAEPVRIPGSGLFRSILEVVQSISSIVQDFGDGIGPSPRRCQLMGFLLVQPEDQVPFLKHSVPYLLVMVAPQVLLVQCGPNEG